jgi:hypothetical protein
VTFPNTAEDLIAYLEESMRKRPPRARPTPQQLADARELLEGMPDAQLRPLADAGHHLAGVVWRERAGGPL